MEIITEKYKVVEKIQFFKVNNPHYGVFLFESHSELSEKVENGAALEDAFERLLVKCGITDTK